MLSGGWPLPLLPAGAGVSGGGVSGGGELGGISSGKAGSLGCQYKGRRVVGADGLLLSCYFTGNGPIFTGRERCLSRLDASMAARGRNVCRQVASQPSDGTILLCLPTNGQ